MIRRYDSNTYDTNQWIIKTFVQFYSVGKLKMTHYTTFHDIWFLESMRILCYNQPTPPPQKHAWARVASWKIRILFNKKKCIYLVYLHLSGNVIHDVQLNDENT